MSLIRGFEGFESFDPASLNGFDLLFVNYVEASFVDRETGTISARTVRIRILEKTESGTLDLVCVEMTDENDVLFVREALVNSLDFQDIKQANNLRIGFVQFSRSIHDHLTRISTKHGEYRLEYVMEDDRDSIGQLVFVQTLKTRMINVFSIELTVTTEDYVCRQAQYRFDALRTEVKQMTHDYNSRMQLLTSKNPHIGRELRNTVQYGLSGAFPSNRRGQSRGRIGPKKS